MKPSSSLVSPLQTLQSTTAPQTPLARAMLPALGARTDWGAPLQSLPHSPPSRPIPSPLHSPQLRANAPSTGRLRPPTPQPFSLLCHPASPLNAVAPPSPNPSFLPPPPLRSLPSPDLLPPPAHLRRSPPPPGSGGSRSWRVGIRAPGPPRLWRVAEPVPVVSAASRLSRSPPRPGPPRRGAARRRMLRESGRLLPPPHPCNTD